MRLLVLTPWFPTTQSPSTAPFMLRDVELLKKDHEVLVVHLANPRDALPGDAPPSGIRVVRVPYHHTDPRTWFGAAKSVRSYARGAELVHTMALPALLPTWLARIRQPWVHTEHYSELVSETLTRRQRVAMAGLRTLFRFPHRAITVSQSLADVVGQHSKVPATVIPNAVRISPVARDDEELRPGGPIRMVAVGGLISRKGPLETVQALSILREEGLDVRLDWVGEGPLANEVRELAGHLGVSRHLTLRGSVSPDEIPAILSRANVFVLPTANETFGVAFAEALAHGLPVIAAGLGGHLEFLPPEGSRVVSHRTGEEIAAAVVDLREDMGRWRTDELIGYARSRFSEKSRLAQYRCVYDLALRDHRAARRRL